ncbi:intradiol ring-cleavage dioxygenase [Zafaria sp. Z1313]|uniref:intradiol ring-cleavage dioxygenase n=1 Tax=unclassified Zafaria TaxID=2828765 RepID=UPI002E7749F5|nr:intradiol ring-cleavage dioxygenase [Zafaria sp. J156]MEE1622369.1 intradiol ring-cleavage dioxygenase [Zafaria sp. J156]
MDRSTTAQLPAVLDAPPTRPLPVPSAPSALARDLEASRATTGKPTHYEGRPLPRPEEDLEDQGLAFDVGTLIGRRRALQFLGLGAAAFGLAACGATGTASSSSSASGLTEIPDETAGPYPGDGSNGPNALQESGIVRSDIRSSFGDASVTAEGIPMTLELTILDMANGNVPFAGVAVYVWHCDRDGNYSLYSEGVEGENYLRGVQIADENGVVRYTSIFPACYTGRWPHIHFEVYPDQDSITDAANAISTSQVAIPQDVSDAVYATAGYESSVRNLSSLTLETDNVFGDDAGATQLATVTGSVGEGYAVKLTVGVDTRTEPTAGTMGGGGGGEGGPGGGGTPPEGAPGGGAPASEGSSTTDG